MEYIPNRVSDHGRPIPQETWNQQYRAGALEGLGSISECAHYQVIVGYVRALRAASAILDVGCGPGHLAEVLAPFGGKRYLGIDLSGEAIGRGRRRAPAWMRFQVADLDEWTPPGRFSVIIFCESLNYALHPLATLLRYAQVLEPDGALIVSLYRHRNHRRIWRNAERYFETASATSLTNHRGQTWDVRVLRRRPL
jgi:2-polyprenyl-3-methyl-5-hydroxy-6-metoxy-1,4-benzoquinol methylase